MYNMNTIHSMLDEFHIQDLKDCKYDVVQHEINFYCYLRNMLSEVQSKFDLATDDANIVYYLVEKLNETKKKLYFHSKISRLVN